jgi:hypothetical protein
MKRRQDSPSPAGADLALLLLEGISDSRETVTYRIWQCDADFMLCHWGPLWCRSRFGPARCDYCSSWSCHLALAAMALVVNARVSKSPERLLARGNSSACRVIEGRRLHGAVAFPDYADGVEAFPTYTVIRAEFG